MTELADATNLAYKTRIKPRDVEALEDLCGVKQQNETLIAKAAAEEEWTAKAMARQVAPSVEKMHQALKFTSLLLSKIIKFECKNETYTEKKESKVKV